MSASVRVPSRGLSHWLPELCLLGFPPAAVAEEVLQRLGHCPSTPPAFVVISVAEPFQVDSSGRMPEIELVELGGQRLYACHRDWSFGPCLALESVAEVRPSLVGLPPHLSCSYSLGDPSSPIRGRGVWPLYDCASACISGQVCLTVWFFISGDAGVPRDPVDLGCDAVGEDTPRPAVDPPQQLLPWARLQVCHPSNCGL